MERGNTHPLIWHCWNYQDMFRLWWSPGNRVNMICSLTPKLLLICILRNFQPISQLRLIDKKAFLVGHTGGNVIGWPTWGRVEAVAGSSTLAAPPLGSSVCIMRPLVFTITVFLVLYSDRRSAWNKDATWSLTYSTNLSKISVQTRQE